MVLWMILLYHDLFLYMSYPINKRDIRSTRTKRISVNVSLDGFNHFVLIKQVVNIFIFFFTERTLSIDINTNLSKFVWVGSFCRISFHVKILVREEGLVFKCDSRVWPLDTVVSYHYFSSLPIWLKTSPIWLNFHASIVNSIIGIGRALIFL